MQSDMSIEDDDGTSGDDDTSANDMPDDHCPTRFISGHRSPY